MSYCYNSADQFVSSTGGALRPQTADYGHGRLPTASQDHSVRNSRPVSMVHGNRNPRHDRTI
jgi:hypothetical protein